MNREVPKSSWWVKILTTEPGCMYYFGAFDSYSEAEASKDSYIQDLKEEGAGIINYQVEQSQPKQLTVDLN